MAELVYILCSVASLLCAWLMIRSYRAGHARVLLWCAVCFIGLALSNVLLVVDLIVVPQIDLSLLRTGTAAIAMGLLVFGLIWRSR